MTKIADVIVFVPCVVVLHGVNESSVHVFKRGTTACKKIKIKILSKSKAGLFKKIEI